MQQDNTTKALCAALNPQLVQVANDIELCLILARLDRLPENILDELAYEFHIEWYDANAAIDVKRALIKSSDMVHMYHGTPYAVEQVVQDYFGDGHVEEWWEYEGLPYHFRVVTSNSAVTGELATQFANAIEKVKRKSTRLDHVLVSMTADFPLYFGFAVHTGDFVTIEQVV
ncbi:phage tail protein I [Desulfitobacterium hafniense]|uniref:phage tail protein I n=1 Tax=Desulfitobacterium hafniense TaxID=49338 RepID=UPI00031E0804|nr:phage tail protein I [Desulfitobacterium hafniense]